MRFHADRLHETDLRRAAKFAEVGLEATRHASRTRDHAFEVKLTGASRRRPMGGSTDDFAATWDQWGIFIAELFEADETLTIPRVYEDKGQFFFKTDWRFMGGEWPEDAHGDHRFRFAGTFGEQSCTKCSAVTRWEI